MAVVDVYPLVLNHRFVELGVGLEKIRVADRLPETGELPHAAWAHPTPALHLHLHGPPVPRPPPAPGPHPPVAEVTGGHVTVGPPAEAPPRRPASVPLPAGPAPTAPNPTHTFRHSAGGTSSKSLDSLFLTLLYWRVPFVVASTPLSPVRQPQPGHTPTLPECPKSSTGSPGTVLSTRHLRNFLKFVVFHDD